VAMCGHVWGQAMEMVRMAKSGGEEVCVKGVWEGFRDCCSGDERGSCSCLAEVNRLSTMLYQV
jgi:hypothetical protein